MSNGNNKTFSYHDLFEQNKEIEERLNEKIKSSDAKFDKFISNDFKEITKDMNTLKLDISKMKTEIGIFKKIGYWIIAGLIANLGAIVWFNVIK